jgi:hypothetical protein
MNRLRGAWIRLRNMFRKERLERELQEELRATSNCTFRTIFALACPPKKPAAPCGSIR